MRPIHEVETRWGSETVVRLRYGGAHEVAGRTTAAQALMNFTRAAKQAAQSTVKLAMRAHQDPTLTPAQRLLMIAEHGKRGLTDLDSRYNALFDEAEARAKELLKRLDDAAAPSANAGRAIQDVALLDSLRGIANPVQALSKVRSDPDLLRAVATAPRALSAFSEEGYAAVRRDYLSTVAPDVLADYDDMVSAMNASVDAHKAAHADVRDVADFDAAAELAAKRVTA